MPTVIDKKSRSTLKQELQNELLHLALGGHHGDKRSHLRAHERTQFKTLYPICGLVYSLGKREALLQPVVLSLVLFAALSLLLTIISVVFLTPVYFKVIRLLSFHLVPKLLCWIPALGVCVLSTALVLLGVNNLLHQHIHKLIAAEISTTEGVDLDEKSLAASNFVTSYGILLVCLLVAFIPFVGFPASIYLRGLCKAYEFALGRATLSAGTGILFRIRTVWSLQFAGLLMALLEIIPILGMVFNYTNLVAKGLYLADCQRVLN